MTGRKLTWLVMCLFLACASMAFAQSNAAPRSSVFDSLMNQDMFFGTDDYFGENSDLIYADIVEPEEEDDTPEPVVVVTRDNDDDDDDEPVSSGDSSGDDGSGGDDPDVGVDPPDVGVDPPDVGGDPIGGG